MKPRQQAYRVTPVTPTFAAMFAVAFLIAGTALVGLLLSGRHTYEPRAGLACPNDGPVDFSKLVGPTARWKPQDPDDEFPLQKVWQELASRQTQGAPAIQVWLSGTLMPSQSKIAAMKSSSGLWTLTLDREGERPAGSTAHSQIALSKSQGDELERMLADPCLYAEPALIGNDYPSANGKPGYCFDGANTFVDIRFAGRRRTAVQACETYGLTGKLVDFLREPLRPGNGAKQTS